MAGRYTGSYLDRRNGWRPVAILAGTGQASLVERIPSDQLMPSHCAMQRKAAACRILSMASRAATTENIGPAARRRWKQHQDRKEGRASGEVCLGLPP